MADNKEWHPPSYYGDPVKERLLALLQKARPEIAAIEELAVEPRRDHILSPDADVLLYLTDVRKHDGSKERLYIRGTAHPSGSRKRAAELISALSQGPDEISSRLPEIIGYIDEWNLLVYFQVPGKALENSMTGESKSEFDLLIRSLAEWLAAFHKFPVSLELPNGQVEEIRRLNRIRGGLKWQQDRAEYLELVDRIESYQKAKLSDSDWRVIHGDFQPHNIIVDGGQFKVIDFNETRVYHPLYDLASFSVQLWAIGWRNYKKILIEEAGIFEEAYFAFSNKGSEGDLVDFFRLRVLLEMLPVIWPEEVEHFKKAINRYRAVVE